MLSWPTSTSRKPSWLKDFFLTYPPITELEEYYTNAWTETHRTAYATCRGFASSNKPRQRQFLELAGLPIPRTFTGTVGSTPRGVPETTEGVGSYVVRPLRHSQGRNYRIISDPSTGWNPEEEYISELYPKRWEYRVIVSRGVPIITLLKKVPEDLSPDLPWNHANGSYFTTVTNPDNDRLRRTNVYDVIRNSELLQHFDLVGLDILYAGKGRYVACELNMCPALTIDTNIAKVANHVLATARVS